MKRIIKIKIILLALALLSGITPGQSSKTGTTAGQVLKIGVGPRALGMGGAFTANSSDISSIYWNPAGLTGMKMNEAFFNHVDWIEDVAYDFGALSVNAGSFGTIGVFAGALTTGDMMVRTIEKPEGTGEMFSFSNIVVGVAFARSLTESFSIGFNVKYLNESIWHMSANGFAMDIGTLYKINILNELRIGASISNFGTKMRLEGRDNLEIIRTGPGDDNLIRTNVELDEFDLPLIFRFGLAADVVKVSTSRITVGADAVHPNDHSEYINAGVEYSWNEIVFLRGGYRSIFEENSEQGLTLGAGINYRLADYVMLKVDYAYQDFGRLKENHYFSVGVGF
ncbi:MAG TPA: PorV/PorQ family protein, partial [Ignavibacteriales bacterium]|nr:PorV/PorQ family protein [Ignavibacteriales bacterium]